MSAGTPVSNQLAIKEQDTGLWKEAQRKTKEGKKKGKGCGAKIRRNGPCNKKRVSDSETGKVYYPLTNVLTPTERA